MVDPVSGGPPLSGGPPPPACGLPLVPPGGLSATPAIATRGLRPRRRLAAALLIGGIVAGCSTPGSGGPADFAPPAGIDPAGPIRVTYRQELPSSLLLSMENHRFAARPQGAGGPGESVATKVVRDEDVLVFLQALQQAGFFDVARRARMAGTPASRGDRASRGDEEAGLPPGVPWRIEVAAGGTRFVADFRHEGGLGDEARRRMKVLVASKRVFHEFYASTFALQAVRNERGVRVFQGAAGAGGDRRRP